MGNPFEGLFDSGDVLERVGIDLTAQARRGDLEPVRCRDAEIARVIDILLRQGKNNAALVGKAGVGKTAVVEGLAQRIARGDVPPALKDARILGLDHVSMLAGTSFRGQYEERLRRLVQALQADRNLILFVDELHNLIGQGTAMGAAMDAANMLKPALVRGDIRVIGATTGEEYNKWVRSDPALERRFQPVTIEELDAIQTWEVLVARRPRLERHHAVAISDDALKASIGDGEGLAGAGHADPRSQESGSRAAPRQLGGGIELAGRADAGSGDGVAAVWRGDRGPARGPAAAGRG
jgi:ATP-dependent Clp protease ATP-binding subunit ClpA